MEEYNIHKCSSYLNKFFTFLQIISLFKKTEEQRSFSLVLRFKIHIHSRNSRTIVHICVYRSAVNILLTKLCQHIFISCSKLLTVKEPSHYDNFSAYLSVSPFSNLEQIYTNSFKCL